MSGLYFFWYPDIQSVRALAQFHTRVCCFLASISLHSLPDKHIYIQFDEALIKRSRVSRHEL